MMSHITILSFILIWCVVKYDAAKILGVFPVPSISHQVVFRPITQELARRGHDVTVITPDPAFPKGGAPKNLREIDVHDISYDLMNSMKNSTLVGHEDDHQRAVFFLMELIRKISEVQMKHKEVAELIKAGPANNFDVILVEAIVRPAFMYTHVFKAPVVLICSLGGMPEHFYLTGAPTHPFLYPTAIQQKTRDLTIIDKLKTLLIFFIFNRVSDYYLAQEDAMLKSVLGSDIPDLKDLGSSVKLILLNVHPIWDNNRPVPPGIVYMGGIHQNPQKELPKDLKSYLDNSKNGVIYVSFGTNITPRHFKPHTLDILVGVLSKLPYDVLWKWDDDTLPGKTENIKISKWLPQSDLLRHPKVLLFITQGGLQSTDEAITAGTPVIGFPMLGDQWYNAEKYEELSIGKRLNIETVDAQEFKDAVETVINDKSYRHNIVRLRTLMNDQLNSPLERSIYWIEHFTRHGGDHFQSPAAAMSIIDYIDLPLLFTLLVISLIICSVLGYLLVCVARLMLRLCVGSKKVKVN